MEKGFSLLPMGGRHRRLYKKCFQDEENIVVLAPPPKEKKKEKKRRSTHWTGHFYSRAGDGEENRFRIEESIFIINQFWCTYVDSHYYHRYWTLVLGDYAAIIQELSALHGVSSAAKGFNEFDKLHDDYGMDVYKVEKLKCYHFYVNRMWSNLKGSSIDDKELAQLGLKCSDLIRTLCFYFVRFQYKEYY